MLEIGTFLKRFDLNSFQRGVSGAVSFSVALELSLSSISGVSRFIFLVNSS